jgi:hypothetical protein
MQSANDMTSDMLDDSCSVISHTEQNSTASFGKPRMTDKVEAMRFRYTSPVPWSRVFVKHVDLYPTPVSIEARAPNDSGHSSIPEVDFIKLVRTFQVRQKRFGRIWNDELGGNTVTTDPLVDGRFEGG